jgi:Protein of unknown function (DUF2924)
VLGHRLQVAAFGDLDKSVRGLLRDEAGGEGSRNKAPFDRRDAQTRDGVALRPGALLVREWRGKLERVMVLEEGFAWNGKNFGSLSQIAKAMTGTNWNGHRFFGPRANVPVLTWRRSCLYFPLVVMTTNAIRSAKRCNQKTTPG